MAEKTVRIAFERAEFTLPIANIVPQRAITVDYRKSAKYRQIAQSIAHVGIIEALVVYPKAPNEYLLLDGHSRLDILKLRGDTEVRCTFSTDDEAYTYNHRVNQVTPIMQHQMILRALENGVPERRLAEALGVEIENIRRKRDLLKGICPEAVHLLRHKQVSIEAFSSLRKMKPVRQVEAAEHMIAGASYSAVFAKSLLAVTKPEFLAQPVRRPKIAARSAAAQEMLGRETEQLIRELKAIEDSYGTDILTLTVCSGYLKRMLANPRVERHLAKTHPELLGALKEALSET
jgi:Trp operon repressor